MRAVCEALATELCLRLTVLPVDDDGRVVRLDVMVRPLNAVMTLQEIVSERMLAFLAKRAEEQ